MNGNFTTEIGRMRMQEAHARAERYRQLQSARRSKDTRETKPLSRTRTALYRKALPVAGVSTMALVAIASL